MTSRARAWRSAAAALATAAAASAIVLSWGSEYQVNVATSLAMSIALSESWIVLSGMTGYISLGHVVFVGLGGYVMALTWGALPIWASLAACGLASGALALAVGYPCLRVRGPYFVILTFGLAEFVKFVVINIEAALAKFGRLIIGAPEESTIFLMMSGLAVAAFLLAFFVRRSRFGAALRAIREDEPASESIGIPATRYKLAAYALSAVVPGLVGGLLLLRTGYFEPSQAFNPVVSLTMITMSIIGGSDDAFGPLAGAVFLVGLSELLWANAPMLYMVLLGLLLIGFVLLLPQGIEGWIRERLRRTASA